MQRYLLNIIFIFIVSGCSIHRERNVSERLDFYGSDLYSLDIHKLESSFENLKDRRILYRDSYIGNFTLYYSPDVIDADTVMVPHLSCYSADLDFQEKEVEEHKNHNRCRYYEVVRFYSEKPGYFFEVKGKIDLDLAKKIAKTWYEENSGRPQYINCISDSKSGISMTISGGACAFSVNVEIGLGENEIKFKEGETYICS